MTCEIKKDKTGQVTAIICRRGGGSVPNCKDCGRRSTKLCDFPLTGEHAGKTCDRPMCNQHAVSMGPNIDYCLIHAQHSKESARQP